MRPIPLLLVLSALLVGGCGATPGSPSATRPPADLLITDGSTARSNVDHLIAIHVNTGRVRALPITNGCGDAQFCLVASAGKLVIGEVGRTYVYDPALPGRPRTRRIGKGWIIVPSMTPGRVWIGPLDCRTHPACRARKIRALRETTLAGRVVRSVHTPHENWPITAVRSALLFQTRNALRLWSVRTRAWSGRVPGQFPAATHRNLVASCGEPCPRLAITNVGTGRGFRIDAPRGYWFSGYNNGAFSADGSKLAVPVGYHPRGAGHPPDRKYALALLDLRSRTASVIEGSVGASAITWSPTADWFYFGRPRGRIMAFRPGAARARTITRLPVRKGPILHLAAL